MTIRAYVGLHGKGKTLGMTRFVLERQARGFEAFTNYGVGGAKTVVTADEIMYLIVRQARSERRRPVVLAISEAGQIWDCRDSRAFPAAMRILVSECRKLHLDFVFDSQDLDDVDVKLRRQVHEVVLCEGIGEKVWMVDEVTGEEVKRPRLFVQRCYRGPTYGTKDQSLLWWSVSRLDKEAAGAFDTDAIIASLGRVLESEWERLERSPMIRVGLMDA